MTTRAHTYLSRRRWRSRDAAFVALDQLRTSDSRKCGTRAQRNEIAVSRRERFERLRGLTHFCGLWAKHVRKPLNANKFEERVQRTAACAIISADRSQVLDSKDGEMSEWLKEHAWKTNQATLTKSP
jgi:hypothetical protein